MTAWDPQRRLLIIEGESLIFPRNPPGEIS